MIQRIKIENYRCFRSLDVELKPFNVLIGPNNTGKSNFLKVLNGIPRFSIIPPREDEFYRFDSTLAPSIELSTTDGVKSLSKPKIQTSLHPDQASFLNQILPTRYFDVPKLVLPMQSEGAKASTDVAEIVKTDGKNLAALLDYMLRKERKLFFELVEALKTMIPGLEDIDIETPTPQTRMVNLMLDGGFQMPASLASMGVRLMIFFATFAFHPTPPKLILIEEPETGVHPLRLARIMELLRGISTGAMGRRPAQIVLTTHSPYLLDCVDLEIDNVLVFQRDADGSRSAKPMNNERLKKYTDEFMLGEFWFNGGDEILTKTGE